MSLLCAYLISGTPVNELDFYLTSDLNNNIEYLVDDTVLTDYQDISSIENWDAYGKNSGKDYKYIRNEIIILAATIGWTNLTITEKTIAAKYFAVASSQRDEIFTLEQQIDLGLYHHIQATESRKIRLAKAQMQIYNRIHKSDWGVISSDLGEMLTHYVNEGREGTVEGDSEGLFDYIDGDSRTGTTWDGTGSEVGFRNKTLTITGYANCSDFSDFILDILKNGNY